MNCGRFWRTHIAGMGLAGLLLVGCTTGGCTIDRALRFVDNPQLPPVIRELEVPRSDGSFMHAYCADFAHEPQRRLPLLVFLSGSGSHSHFTLRDGRTNWGLYGVLARAAQGRFHVVASEKRGVAFGENHGGEGTQASAEYTQYATWNDRVADAKLLIDEMLKQPNVDPACVLVVGHSEGADVAAGVAAAEPRITHVAFLAGGGPSQMFDLLVLRRKEMRKAGHTPEEIEAAVQELEGEYRAIMADPLSTTKFFEGHAYRRWSTFFRHPPAEELLRSKAKIFAAQGSEDESGPIEAFDYFVAEVLRTGRENVTLRRFPGCDHGFRKVGAPRDGPPMVDLFKEVLDWAAPAAASQPAP